MPWAFSYFEYLLRDSSLGLEYLFGGSSQRD